MPNVTITEAPAGAKAWSPGAVTVKTVLTPVAASSGGSSSSSSSDLNQNSNEYIEVSKYLPDYPGLPKVGPLDADKAVICFDTETTGLNPWEIRMLVCSFWDLREPKSSMVTFSNWDEEQLILDIMEYLNSSDVDTLVAYNINYDIRMLFTRCMAWQVPAPSLAKAKLYDVMDTLAKGGEKYNKATGKPGALEDWTLYFYGEDKPYSIDECFAALEVDDLNPMILRNRWDVGMEGDLYLLAKAVLDGDESVFASVTPTLSTEYMWEPEGKAIVQCPNCLTEQEYPTDTNRPVCFVCGTDLPGPGSARVPRVVEPIAQYPIAEDALIGVLTPDEYEGV